MKRAALIVNAKEGRKAFQTVESTIASTLIRFGYEPEIHRTSAVSGSASALARDASTRCELVIACGGDGTVHEVLQGVAGTQAVLGVLPFGTANALARNLQLPMDPVRALEKLLHFRPETLPLGRVQAGANIRWFAVMAGAGPDGTLVREMQAGTKAKAGRHAYYAEAARLFFTRRFPTFQVEYKRVGSAQWERQSAVAVMMSRIADLGGLFSRLTRTSRLHHPHLQLQLLRGPAHLSLPAWMAFARMALDEVSPWMQRLEVESVRCVPLNAHRPVYAQVDGEAFGALPFHVDIEQKAVRMLMPGAYVDGSLPTGVTRPEA